MQSSPTPPADPVPPVPPARSLRGLAARVLAVLLGVFVPLLVCELALRILPEKQTFATGIRDFKEGALTPDPRFGWRPRPGAAVTVQGVPYAFTNAGTRKTPVDDGGKGPQTPGAGEPQPGSLLIVGDSVTMGWGVKNEDTFASGVERASAQAGRPWPVINGGVVGYGIDQDVARLDALAGELAPRAALLGYYLNDPEGPESAPKGHGPSWSRLLQMVWPGVEAILQRTGDRLTATEHHRRLHEPGSPGWARVLAGFKTLGAACKARNIRCGVVILPELYERPYPLADVHARVLEAARAEGIAGLDLAPSIADLDPRSLWVAKDDAHPNATGHARYATAIAAWIAAGALDGPAK